jgi:2,4-dienoyl-CoA reductase-like NADH-dependent reductase (Old Yellow Enzyme family)
VTAYPRLFAPLPIGPVTSRNRVVFGAHFTMMSEPNPTWGEPGWFGARVGRYAGDRAAGGVGVVIVGHAHVHPSTAYSMRNNSAAWTEEAVAHFRDVTAPIHEHGALAFVQLSHSGAKSSTDWSGRPLLAPSHGVVNSEAPKVIERHEIAEIVDHFALSARHAVAGGFDGIEIHGAHHYLVHEFLSPNANRRDDDYGGSFENRMRFVVEVLEAVRAEVGPGVAVGLRLAGDDRNEDGSGVTPAYAARVAVELERRGLVDFLNVSIGNLGGLVQPMYHPHLLGVYAAKVVRDAVHSTPVFAVHRIVTPVEAEGVLERGEADAITLVRALIADPDWVGKARDGRASEIRPCTGCNQLCYGNLYRSLPIQCAQNPAVGRDAELGSGTLVAAPARRKVVVVGGGPAGLEAAWVAAARGHEVVLLERDHQVGGLVRLAAALPGRGEMLAFADWRAAECERRGVEVRLGVEASVADVLDLGPDVVVVATGGRAGCDLPPVGKAEVPGLDLPHVLDHVTATARPELVGDRVVIVDVVGHVEGAGLAEMLALAGREVTLSCPLPWLARLDSATAAGALRGAGRAGVRWRPSTRVLSVDEVKVTLLDTLSGTAAPLAADTVVVRTHGRPDDRLYHDLTGAELEVHRIGDALAVRTVDRAIHDGHLLGRAL